MTDPTTIALFAAAGSTIPTAIKELFSFLFKNRALASADANKQRDANSELLSSLFEKVTFLEKARMDDQTERFKERDEAHRMRLAKEEELHALTLRLQDLENQNASYQKKIAETEESYLRRIAQQDKKIAEQNEKINALEKELGEYKAAHSAQ